MPLTGPEFFPENQQIDKCVIMLHGYGADGNDLIGLAPILSKSVPGCAFFSPDGPEPCEISPFGRQWFSLAESDPEFKRRSASTQKEAFEGMYQHAEKVAPIIEDYINQIREKYSLSEKQVALLGFSQGTMMALHLGYRTTPSYRCLVGFSGALVGESYLEKEMTATPPTLLVHGDQDDMLPVNAVHIAEKALTKCGQSPKVVICNNLMHSIDIAGLRTAGAFLQSEFDK